MATRLRKYLDKRIREYTASYKEATSTLTTTQAAVLLLQMGGPGSDDAAVVAAAAAAAVAASSRVKVLADARQMLMTRFKWVADQILGSHGNKRDRAADVNTNGLTAKKNRAYENMQDGGLLRPANNGTRPNGAGMDGYRSGNVRIEMLRRQFEDLRNKRATLKLRIESANRNLTAGKRIGDTSDVEELNLQLQRVQVRMKAIDQNNVDARYNKWTVAGTDGRILVAAIRNWLQHTAGRLTRFLSAVGAQEERAMDPLWRGYNEKDVDGSTRALLASQSFAVPILTILEQELHTHPHIYGPQSEKVYNKAVYDGGWEGRELSRRTGRIFFRASDTDTRPHLLDVAKLYDLPEGPGIIKRIVELLDEGEVSLVQQHAYQKYLDAKTTGVGNERRIRARALSIPVDQVAGKVRDVVKSWSAAKITIHERVKNTWSEIVSLYRQGALSAAEVEESYTGLVAGLGGTGYARRYANGDANGANSVQYGEQALTWKQRRIFKDLIGNMKEFENFLRALWNKTEDLLPILNAYQEWLRRQGAPTEHTSLPLVGRQAGFTDRTSAPGNAQDTPFDEGLDINWTGIKEARKHFRALQAASHARGQNLFPNVTSDQTSGQSVVGEKRKVDGVTAELTEKALQCAFDKVLGKDHVGYGHSEDCYGDDEELVRAGGLINLKVPPIWAFQRSTMPRYCHLISEALEPDLSSVDKSSDPNPNPNDMGNYLYSSPLTHKGGGAPGSEGQGTDYWYRCDRDGLMHTYELIKRRWRRFSLLGGFDAKFGRWQSLERNALDLVSEEYAVGIEAKEELERAHAMIADAKGKTDETHRDLEWSDQDYESVLSLLSRRITSIEREEATRRAEEFKRRGYIHPGSTARRAMTRYQAHELARCDTLKVRNMFGEGALLEAIEEGRAIGQFSLEAAKMQRLHLLRLIEERDELMLLTEPEHGDGGPAPDWVQQKYYLVEWQELEKRRDDLVRMDLDAKEMGETRLALLNARIKYLLEYAGDIRGQSSDEEDGPEEDPEARLPVDDVVVSYGTTCLTAEQLEASDWGIYNLYGGEGGVDDGARTGLETIDQLEERLEELGLTWTRYTGVSGLVGDDARRLILQQVTEPKLDRRAKPPSPGEAKWITAVQEMSADGVPGTGEADPSNGNTREYTMGDIRAHLRLSPDSDPSYSSIAEQDTYDVALDNTQGSVVPPRATTRHSQFAKCPFLVPPARWKRLSTQTRRLLYSRVLGQRGGNLPPHLKLAWYAPSGFGHVKKSKATGVWDRLPPGMVQQTMDGRDMYIETVIVEAARTDEPDRMLWALPLEVRRTLYLNEERVMYTPTVNQRTQMPIWNISSSRWDLPSDQTEFYTTTTLGAIITLTEAGRRFWVGPGPEANLPPFCAQTFSTNDKSPEFIAEFKLQLGRVLATPYLESIPRDRLDDIRRVTLNRMEVDWIGRGRSWLDDDAPGGGDGIQKTLIDNGLVRWVPYTESGVDGRWDQTRLLQAFGEALSVTQPEKTLHWTTIGQQRRVCEKFENGAWRDELIGLLLEADTASRLAQLEEDYYAEEDYADTDDRMDYGDYDPLTDEEAGKTLVGQDGGLGQWQVDVQKTLVDSLARMAKEYNLQGAMKDEIDDCIEAKFKEYMEDAFSNAQDLVDGEIERRDRLQGLIPPVSYWDVVHGIVADPDATDPPPPQQEEQLVDYLLEANMD